MEPTYFRWGSYGNEVVECGMDKATHVYLTRADFDALVRERDEERHWKCFHARSAEAAAERVVELWKRVKEAESQRDEAERRAASAMVDRAKALARAEKAEEALRWYASQSSWAGSYCATTGIHSEPEAYYDKGAKAREALGGPRA